MIASIKRPKSKTATPAWHAAFIAMVPTIRRSAQITFRKVRPELRQELIEEVLANSCAAYARLVEQGKTDQAYPSVLARFAIAQVRAGRRVGNRQSAREVLSQFAQYKNGFQVEPLVFFDAEENCWQEVVVEDQTATPAEIAACRIDFGEWLRLLPAKLRKIALTLAGGESTKGAAEKFGVSSGRISQMRLLLKESWQRFQGESDERPQLAVA